MLTPTLLQAVQGWASVQPDHIAIEEWQGDSLSYFELWELTQVYHRAIDQRSIHHNNRIAIILPRSSDFIASLLGAWLSKCTPIIVDPEWPNLRIQSIIEDAQPDLIIDARIAQSNSEAAPSSLPLVEANSVAYIIYSSGSSGRPKGILVPHAGLHDMLSDQILAFRLTPSSRSFWMHGIAFDASISDIGTVLLAGATLCFDPHFCLHSKGEFLNQLEVLNISHVDIPPALLSVLDADQCPATLKTLIIGGEVTPPNTIQTWAKKKRIINVYGPSEATVCTSMTVCSPEWILPLIGAPMTNVQYRIYNSHNPLEDSEEGELHITGPGVALGYLNQPNLTESRFYQTAQQRTFRTGDHVRKLQDGSIEFLGRIDRQVKVHGKLLCPEEVESKILSHPSVQQVHVAYIESKITAWIQLKDDHQSDDLASYLSSHLPHWMIPTQWNILDQLPRLQNGKIDAHAIYHQKRSTLIPVAYDNTLEDHITTIMRNTLNEPDLKSSDDFFSSGGDSLSSIIFLAKAEISGLQLPPNCLNQFRTAQGIAQHLMTGTSYVQPRHKLIARVSKTHKMLLENLENKTSLSVSKTHRQTKGLLLTGASGFLGSNILGELLNKTAHPILCLVRGNQDDKQRLILSKLKKHGFNITESQAKRIQLISADIDKDNLGLTDKQWLELSSKVERIIHCAADLSLLKTIDELENTNVHGTRRLLELVHSGPKKRFIYASTLSVFVDAFPTPNTCRECDTLDRPGTQVFGGYAQSKWVAEKIIHSCQKSKQASTIIRLGLLTPNSVTGYTADNDPFHIFIKSLQTSQPLLEPDAQASMDFTPVNYAASAIVEIASRGEVNKTYHVANSTSLSYASIKDALTNISVPLSSLTPSQTSCSELIFSASAQTSNHNNSLNLFKTTNIEFCTKNTRNLLADTYIICPAPTPNYLTPYLSNICNHPSS